MNRIIIFVTFIVLTNTAQSQTTELPDFSADRPGMATSPYIVNSKSFQIETGFSSENDNRENYLVQTFLYISSLLRYGINKNAEIRLQTDFANVKTDSLNTTGFNPLTIGTKLLITEGKNIIPKTSFLFNLTLPYFGEKNFKPNNFIPSFYLLMQNDINKKLNVCYNVGLEFDGKSSIPTKFIAICFGYSMTEKFSGFVENYNWFSSIERPEYFVDCGLTYMIKKNIQLDISGSLNLQNINKYYMFSFGLTCNF